MARKDDFDWRDDPFDEKTAHQQQGGMGSGSKLALGCGCLVAVVGIVVLLMFALVNVIDIVAA